MDQNVQNHNHSCPKQLPTCSSVSAPRHSLPLTAASAAALLAAATMERRPRLDACGRLGEDEVTHFLLVYSSCDQVGCE